jgi:hypothetical protein
MTTDATDVQKKYAIIKGLALAQRISMPATLETKDKAFMDNTFSPETLAFLKTISYETNSEGNEEGSTKATTQFDLSAESKWRDFVDVLEQETGNFSVQDSVTPSGQAVVKVGEDVSADTRGNAGPLLRINFRENMTSANGKPISVIVSVRERCACPNVAILNSGGYVITRCPHKARYDRKMSSAPTPANLWEHTKINPARADATAAEALLKKNNALIENGRVCGLHNKSTTAVLIDWANINAPVGASPARDDDTASQSLIRNFTTTVTDVEENVESLIENFKQVNEENTELIESVIRYSELLKEAQERASENSLLVTRSRDRLESVSTKAKSAKAD